MSLRHWRHHVAYQFSCYLLQARYHGEVKNQNHIWLDGKLRQKEKTIIDREGFKTPDLEEFVKRK